MKRTNIAVLTLIFVSGSVFARDAQKTLPLQDALDTPATREKLGKNINCTSRASLI